MDAIQQELREVRCHSKADFEFMAAGMGHTARQMQALADTVAREMGEMSERMTQVEGRMRLHDRRFDRMLEAVHTALGDTVRRGELLELVSRLEVLERKVDPAA